MNLSPLPIQKFFDNNGNPLTGGLLFTYVAGTSTKVATSSDQAGTPNTNPVVLNYRGEANVWLDQTLTYKFVLSPEGDTDPPTRPIWTVDNISAGVTFASLTASIIGQILWPRDSLETATSTTPSTYIYPYNDPRRAPSFYDNQGQTDYGDVPTYIDATHFSVPGNQTTRYSPYTRITAVGASSRANVRCVSAVFGAVTTVTITTADNGGTLPNPMLAVWVQKTIATEGPGSMVLNVNTAAGQVIVNAANGTLTGARTSWFTLNGSGVADANLNCVAVSPSYSGAYIAGGFASGGRGVIYTPPTMSLEIGTSDVARILIPSGGTAIVFTSDIAVSKSGAGIISTSGSTSGRISLQINSVESGYLFTNGTEVQTGSITNIDYSILQNSTRVLTFRGGNTTGASTPTVTANKPGANAGIIEWVAVKTSGGTNGWQPIWGN